ncbi:MAG TPA: hypothetical protein VGE12_15245 [Noviherbaspirillum sp.]
MTDTRRLAPPSREQWLRSLDARHPASRERSLLWDAACRGEIAYAELQQRIAELLAQHADDEENMHRNTVYDHERLPDTPRYIPRKMPTRAA